MYDEESLTSKSLAFVESDIGFGSCGNDTKWLANDGETNPDGICLPCSALDATITRRPVLLEHRWKMTHIVATVLVDIISSAVYEYNIGGMEWHANLK